MCIVVMVVLDEGMSVLQERTVKLQGSKLGEREYGYGCAWCGQWFNGEKSQASGVQTVRTKLV